MPEAPDLQVVKVFLEAQALGVTLTDTAVLPHLDSTSGSSHRPESLLTQARKLSRFR